MKITKIGTRFEHPVKIKEDEYKILLKYASLLKDKYKLNKITYKWDAEKLRLGGADIATDIDIVKTYGFEIIAKELLNE